MQLLSLGLSGGNEADGLPPAASMDFGMFHTMPGSNDREVVVRSLLSTTTKGNTDRPR